MTPEQEMLTPQLEAAEKAVAVVKDPRLREIAFGRIVDHLLGLKSSDGKTADHAPIGKRTRKRSLPQQSQVAPPASQGRMKTGPADGIRYLIEDGKLDSPKSTDQITELLKQDGRHYARKPVGVALLRLARERVLTRLKEKEDDNWKYAVRR